MLFRKGKKQRTPGEKKRLPRILGESKEDISGKRLKVDRVVLSPRISQLIPILRKRQERLRSRGLEDQIYLTGRIENNRIVVENIGLMPARDIEKYAKRNAFRGGRLVSEKGGLPENTVGMLHSHVDQVTPEQVPKGAEEEFWKEPGKKRGYRKAIPSEADVFHITSIAAAREKQTKVILMFDPDTGKLVAWAAHPDGSVTRIDKFTLRLGKRGKH